jgi:hypothetical protein
MHQNLIFRLFTELSILRFRISFKLHIRGTGIIIMKKMEMYKLFFVFLTAVLFLPVQTPAAEQSVRLIVPECSS